MRFGVFTVSMPDYEPLECLEKLADLGYDGVEWRVTQDTGDRSKPSFWSGNRSSMTAEELIRRAAELKAKSKATKIAMPSLGAYIGASDLAVVETHLKAAAAIGAKHVRISPGGYDADKGQYAKQAKEARKQYAKVARLAGKYRVRAVIETHMGQLGPSVSKARAIIEGMDPKHVGIMWDVGNQIVEGAERYAMAIDIAGEYLAEVHVKNMRFERGKEESGQTLWSAVPCPVREGMVNWPVVIAELRKAGFDGWLHFEDFSTQVPLPERLKMNIEWFRELAK